MKQIHSQEKEQFIKLFQQEHIENIDERFKILEIFLQTEKHVTVSEFQNILVNNGYQFDADFVKDTLRLMLRFGFARKNRFENGEVHYEHMHLGQHHDHMICTKCHKIIEFKDDRLESLQVRISSDYDFYMLQHKMEIYGLCSNCLKDRVQRMPLVLAKSGEKMIIKEFSGGSKSKMRLLTMGLRIGDQIEIVTNPSMGQLVVAAEHNRYVLGRGLAKKILVEPAIQNVKL